METTAPPIKRFLFKDEAEFLFGQDAMAHAAADAKDLMWVTPEYAKQMVAIIYRMNLQLHNQQDALTAIKAAADTIDPVGLDSNIAALNLIEQQYSGLRL